MLQLGRITIYKGSGERGVHQQVKQSRLPPPATKQARQSPKASRWVGARSSRSYGGHNLEPAVSLHSSHASEWTTPLTKPSVVCLPP